MLFLAPFSACRDIAEQENEIFAAVEAADARSQQQPQPSERTISVYDDIMRTVGAEQGLDWRFMSAIAYSESRFDPTVVSRRGATGLMQIMPATCRQFGIDREDIADPETNVRTAAMLIRTIEKSLRFSSAVTENDRMSIVLACYNGGIGHVNDARRLARAFGENPDSWQTVSRYLALKSDSLYYEHEVVKCGRFTGAGETKAFVAQVMRNYGKYCSIVD